MPSVSCVFLPYQHDAIYLWIIMYAFSWSNILMVVQPYATRAKTETMSTFEIATTQRFLSADSNSN